MTSSQSRTSLCFRTAATLAAFLLFGASSLWPQDLPVKRVVLYKNGLGYFEHDGRVTGNQNVEILLPSRQLDDVLKSLTVIDRGRGQIGAITYDSAESVARRLSDLPVKVDPAQGLIDFLNRIPGAEVEVAVPPATGGAPAAPVVGRLMGAEIRQKKSGEYIIGQTMQLNLLTQHGEVRTIELPSTAGVRLVKPELAAELRDYLTVLDSAHQRDSRRLRIATTGAGDRGLLVSYTSESPIWKTTYRLVLDAQRKPFLQGWAIVDNTTANDWENVDLSLVAGQPVSFIQNLSQPIYGRRPVIPMAQGFEVSPQTHEATLELPAGASGISGTVTDATGAVIPGATVSIDGQGHMRQVFTDSNGRFEATLDPGKYAVKVAMRGFKDMAVSNVNVTAGRATSLNPALSVGSTAETVTVTAQSLQSLETSNATVSSSRNTRWLKEDVVYAPKPGLTLSNMIRESDTEVADAQPVGDQFEYKIRQPVTIHRNQSALLPIVNSEIDGEKVVVYNEAGRDRRPRLAVWLKNSSPLTLDSGSFNVIDSNAFAGEGLTDAIHPGERRLLSYALDSGLAITSALDSEKERLAKTTIIHGVMTQTRQAREKKTYVIRNNDDKPRVVVVEHTLRPGWKLVDTPDPAETTAGFYRFRVEVKPKTTTQLVVQESNPVETTYKISDIDEDDISTWFTEKSLDPATEKAIREVIRRQSAIAEQNNKLQALANEKSGIEKDQSRLRDNLSRLNPDHKDETTLRQRYIRQMEEQEDRLAQIKSETQKLQDAVDKAQQSLEEYIQAIAIGS